MAKLYPGGKKKAFNITYDDGVLQDERFVELLNRYGIKGTFNLNSQLMQEAFSWIHPNGMQVKRLSPERAKHLYDGHEVASHTLTHPYMHELSDEELYRQLKSDKDNLEKLFDREVKGFAVPFEYYDDRIADCAKACGFTYARESECTGNFIPCTDAYHWKTGIYHIDPDLPNFVAKFLNTQEELAVCQIVGHSYDLDAENLWGTMELICAAVSKCDDIWFCTNAELVDFLSNHGKISVPLKFQFERRCAVENIVIRKISSDEVESAMSLALEVFMQFEAPDYGPMGVETFKKDIVENPEYLENAKLGVCPIYGAFDGDKIVALMGMRSSKTHINLVFTKKAYHRKGIARAIFRYLLNDILRENPALDALTLNASPYGLPFYLALGFIPLSEEQKINGIRFTPMKYIIKR